MLYYPKSIIPKINNKYINIDRIKRLRDTIIVRRSEATNVFDTFYPDGKVNPKALFGLRGFKALPGYSMNLLGGKFKPKDICYKQNGQASDYWELSEKIVLREYVQEVKKMKNSIGIYIPLWKLHNISIPYERSKDPEVKKKLAAFMSALKDISRVQFNGNINVKHKPNKLNFWHVELHLTEDEKMDSKNVAIKNSEPDTRPIEEQAVGMQFGQHIWEQVLQDNSKDIYFYKVGKVPKNIYKQ